MIESPCRQLCSLEPASRQCVGCGRRAEEIAGWTRFSNDERRAIIAALPDRLDAMRAERIARNAARQGRSRRRGASERGGEPC